MVILELMILLLISYSKVKITFELDFVHACHLVKIRHIACLKLYLKDDVGAIVCKLMFFISFWCCDYL